MKKLLFLSAALMGFTGIPAAHAQIIIQPTIVAPPPAVIAPVPPPPVYSYYGYYYATPYPYYYDHHRHYDWRYWNRGHERHEH